MKKLILLSILLISVSSLFGQRDKKQIEKAQKLNTIESYERFLDKFPSSSYSEIAYEGIFKIYEKKKSIEAFEEFLRKYPNNDFSKNAMKGIFSFYEKGNSIDSYKDFISKYPENVHVKDAERKIDSLSFSIAKESNTIQSLQKYLDDFPNGINKKEAISLLDELTYEKVKQIGTLDSYKEYLGAFRNGKFTQIVKEKCDSMTYFQATEAGDLNSYLYYKQQYPNGKFIDSAIEKIDSLRFLKLNRSDESSVAEYIASKPPKKYIDLLIGDLDEHHFYNKCRDNKYLSDLMYYKKKFPNGKHYSEIGNLIETTKQELRISLSQALKDTLVSESTEFLTSIRALPLSNSGFNLSSISKADAIYSATYLNEKGGLGFYGVVEAMHVTAFVMEEFTKLVDRNIVNNGMIMKSALSSKNSKSELQKYFIIFNVLHVSESSNGYNSTINVGIEYHVIDTRKLEKVYSQIIVKSKTNYDTPRTYAEWFNFPQKMEGSINATAGNYGKLDFGNIFYYSYPAGGYGKILFVTNLPKECEIIIKNRYRKVASVSHVNSSAFGYEMIEVTGQFDRIEIIDKGDLGEKTIKL